VLCVYASVYAQRGGLYSDVKILDSDERGITIEFRPKYFPNEKIYFDGNTFERPNFQFGYFRVSDQAGKEDIRGRVIQFALPGRRGSSVSVVSADYETVGGFSLAPVPEIEPLDGFGATKKFYKPNFTSQDFYPQSIVRLTDASSVKGWIVSDLIVTPYQYQSATKTLRKYTRIVVRIDYGSQESAFDGSEDDEWAQVSLINYPVAKRWVSVQTLQKTAAINSVLSSGTWFKMEVAEEGIYKIDANYLRSMGVDPSSLSSILDVKIFGADGRNIAENLNTPRPDDLPQMVVRYVDNNSNSKFDSDDYILFYGRGVTGWNYSPVQKQFSHYTNPYTNSNYYFLRVGANVATTQAQIVSVAGGSGGKVTTAMGKVFFDEDKFNFNQSGQQWVSPPLNPGESRVVSNKLTGWISGTSVRYRYFLYSRANVDATFTLEESGATIGSPFISRKSDGDLNSPIGTFANPTSGQFTVVPALTDQRSNVKFTYNAGGTVANGYIDWLEVYYQQQLTASNNVLVFSSADTSGIVEYAVNGFTTNSFDVYEVSNPNNLRKIVHQLDQLVGTCTFSDTLSPGEINTYWIGTAANYKQPKSFSKIPNSNIHGFAGAEFVIISHSEFKSEAQRLKTHKENLPPKKRLSTVVVDIDTIYNEFGIGMPDPVSIRDFLRYATTQWTIKPKYLLFFGDASFDFKSILNTDRSWVPSFQTNESNYKIDTYNYDDFFSYLDSANPTRVSIAHGRLTVRSIADARLLIDRIIQYETNIPKSTWKNIITIVGDDTWTPESQSETAHTEQAEELASFHTPEDFEVKKIYIGEYPTVFASSGRRKPAARQALLDQVNKGTLMLNYTGHGNPKVWAHESILTFDDVKSQFTNGGKLTFIVAATCDWGRFDEAGEQSSGEEVMVNRNGGAIGVLSATRAVWSDQNALTNYTFYDFLFSGSPVLRFGDAYLLTKNSLSQIVNKQKYHLLGDPTLYLAAPSEKISIDSINGISITNVDTVHALQKITITATVRDTNNLKKTGFTGTALVTVFDGDRRRSVSDMPGFTYRENGAIIYKGENSIKNGVMEASFIVPKDISYENKNGRISVYFSNASTDGRGYTRNFIVGGTNPQTVPDSAGPNISIYLDNPLFRSGDLVSENPTLIVDLKDSSGINSSGSGIGHRIEAWIDGGAKGIDLTEFYKGTIDSFQEGTVEYSLSNLLPGSHSIKVRAWDVYNNSSVAEAYFAVSSGDGLSIQQLYNFPNPVSTTTSFTFQHNQLTPIDVEIKIYTVAGRLIHTIQHYGYSDRFVKIDWSRRDGDGDEVGNGIYFYKVTAKTIDGKFTSEAIGKLAVVR